MKYAIASLVFAGALFAVSQVMTAEDEPPPSAEAQGEPREPVSENSRSEVDLEDPVSQWIFGSLFLEGTDDVEKDYEQAFEWFSKSAEQDFDLAQHDLGWMYSEGKGVAKSQERAIYWYRKAAEQGNANSQYSLGVIFEFGKGVPKDYMEAASWYRKAAKQGFGSAQLNLGLMYEHGRGVAQNYKKALSWYRKAEKSGSEVVSLAQNQLGQIYEHGRGVAKDEKKAVEWYRKSAEQGCSFAQASLGRMYAEGRGVPKDYVLAYHWMNLAAADGFEDDRAVRDDLERKMGPAAVEEAQRMTREWLKAKEPQEFVSLEEFDRSSKQAVNKKEPIRIPASEVDRMAREAAEKEESEKGHDEGE